MKNTTAAIRNVSGDMVAARDTDEAGARRHKIRDAVHETDLVHRGAGTGLPHRLTNQLPSIQVSSDRPLQT